MYAMQNYISSSNTISLFQLYNKAIAIIDLIYKPWQNYPKRMVDD